jgi:hypothetical protein
MPCYRWCISVMSLPAWSCKHHCRYTVPYLLQTAAAGVSGLSFVENSHSIALYTAVLPSCARDNSLNLLLQRSMWPSVLQQLLSAIVGCDVTVDCCAALLHYNLHHALIPACYCLSCRALQLVPALFRAADAGKAAQGHRMRHSGVPQVAANSH